MARQPHVQALLPDLSDSTLKGSWLNARASGAVDYSYAGNDGTVSGQPIFTDSNGISLDGTDDKIDFGDIGNIAEIAMWINPGSTTEEIILVDAGNDIMVSAGTVTYTGLTATATYVDGAASTTLAANQWQHLVCQFNVIDANNFELGTDGANFGDIDVRDLRAYSTARTADQIKIDYLAGVPDSSLVLSMQGDVTDESVYGLTFTSTNDAIVGNGYEFDGIGDYLINSTANWRSTDNTGTIMAWIKRNAIGAFHTILGSMDEGTAGTHLFRLGINNANKVFAQTGVNADYDRGFGTKTISANRWYHIAWCTDGSTWAVYVNGVAQSLTFDQGSNRGRWLDDVQNRDNVTIGISKWSALDSAFNGDIRDLRVFSEDKPVEYILQHYNSTKGRY